MKKLLIATSAVVGLGLVSADFASAQLETSFSGLVRVRMTKGASAHAGANSATATDAVAATWTAATVGAPCTSGYLVAEEFSTTEITTTSTATDFCYVATVAAVGENYSQQAALSTNRAQLQWDAKGTSDSGLTYGARIRLRPTATAAARSSTYIYFGGGFGQVTLGEADASESAVSAGISGAASGGLDGDINNATQPTQMPSNAAVSGPDVTGNHAGDNRILYVSPSFGGVTLAADYYTDSNGNKDNGGAKGMSVAVKYSGEFDGGSFNVATGMHRGSNEGTLNGTTVEASTKSAMRGFGLGADASFGPIKVGFNYMSTGKSGATKFAATSAITAGALKGGQKTMLFSAAYNFGAGNVSLGYGTAKATTYSTDAAETTYSDKQNVLVGGVDYTVAPGWSVYAEASRVTTKTGAAQTGTNSTSASATSWLLGTNVAF